MRELTSASGLSAGKIWSVLNKKGRLNKEDLLVTTKLNENELYSGVGWLARENKITLRDDFFLLENSNLEPDIGTNAGKIWKILDIWGDVDLESLKRLSSFNDEQVYSALGWLAREDKIQVNKDNRFILK